jgi:acyl carrier protein
MELDDRLWRVFVAVLELAPETPRSDVRRAAVGWDSLGHMSLVMAIEDEFGLALTADHVIEIESFDSALAIVIAATASA